MRHISIKCRSYKWKFTMLCVLLAAISCLITVNFEADATGSRNLTATQTGSTWTGNEGYRPYTEWYGSSTGEIPRHQILKVYVNANETLYLGSSVAAGIGGDIVVRKPDGTPVDPSLLNVDAQTGIGYIDSRVKELAGPICPGGDTTGTGYKPLSIPVDKTGVWEVEFHSTDNSVTDPASALTSSGTFAANQHTGTVAAWDITVVKDGVIIPGRVFANFLSLNMGLNAPGANVLTAAVYVLTNDGYVY